MSKQSDFKQDEGLSIQVADRRRWQSAMTSPIGDVGSERVKVALPISFIPLICGYFCLIRYQTSHNYPSWSNPKHEFGLSMILWSLHSSGLPTFYVTFQSLLAMRL